jgi:hypothetical protein
MKKKLIKKIKHFADQLPEKTYLAYPKIHVPVKDGTGQEIQVLGLKVERRKEIYKVNHVRRIKRLVEKHGYDEGIKLYAKELEKI